MEIERLLSDLDANLGRAARAFDAVAGPYGESLVLVGAGPLGCHTAQRLTARGLRPLAFADNSPALVGKQIEGLPVFPVPQALERFGDAAVFVVTIFNRTAITEQLTSLGCRRVVPYALLFAKYPHTFVPYWCLDRPEKLAADKADILAMAMTWHDVASRAEYVRQLERRVFVGFDREGRAVPNEVRVREYFPTDVYAECANEVLVDCGAFSGDTVVHFLKLRGTRFSKILAVEPDPETYRMLLARVAGLPETIRDHVQTRRVAIDSQRGVVRFSARGDVTSSVNSAGEVEIESDTLDGILAGERPTLIKMDVEGMEIEALRGASGVMLRHEPVFAISVYHRPDHLWRIPLFIRSVSPGYRFFLRAHAEDCWDACCYAVPEKRLLR